MRIDSNGEGDFFYDGIKFVVTDAPPWERPKSEGQSFTIVKGKSHFDYYKRISELDFQDIIEVGFYEGGSSVYFDRLFSPARLTCVDIREDRIAAVDQYIKNAGREEAFQMIYGFDQSDQNGLVDLVNTRHGGEVDLVIDDASHDYHLSRATFEALFPFVCPGGLYILEDYGWAHTHPFQSPENSWVDRSALSNLVFELTMVCASNSELISKLEICEGLCAVTKGPRRCDSPMRISNEYLARGKRLPLI